MANENKIEATINYGLPDYTLNGGLGADPDGLGSFNWKLSNDQLNSVYSTAFGRYLVANRVSLKHIDSTGVAGTALIAYLFNNIYRFVYSKYTPSSEAPDFGPNMKISDIIGSIKLLFYPFIRVDISAASGTKITPTSTIVTDMYNFGNTGKLKVGVEVSWTLGDTSVVTKYAAVTGTPSSITANGSFSIPPSVNESGLLGPDASINFLAGLHEGIELAEYESASIAFPSTLLTDMGCPSTVGTDGTTLRAKLLNIIVKPIVYYGTIISYAVPSGGFSYIHDANGGGYVTAYADVLSSVNAATISIQTKATTYNNDSVSGTAAPYISVGSAIAPTGDDDITLIVTTSPLVGT
jgi:hypothetical protein